MAKITYKDLIEKRNIILSLATEAEVKSGKSKLVYAMRRWEKSIKSILSAVNDKFDEINLKHAEEDKVSRVVLTDAQGRFQYTKENETLKRQEFKLAENTEYEFEPYLFTDEKRIAEFDEFAVEELKGIFLP